MHGIVMQGSHFHYAILGDLNTMAHGIARLSPAYCCDRMRFLSFGSDEAVMWERYVLSMTDLAFHPSNDHSKDQDQESGQDQGQVNWQLQRWGCPLNVATAAMNPGFTCPFPAATTVTLDNPTYKLWGISFMRGKLDWTLLRRVAVTSTQVGNLDYRLSDHRWLLVEGHLE